MPPASVDAGEPLGNFSLRSGKLNVVEPSPVPNRVETAVNNSAYVLLDTAEPSHNKYPNGIDANAQPPNFISPVTDVADFQTVLLAFLLYSSPAINPLPELVQYTC